MECYEERFQKMFKIYGRQCDILKIKLNLEQVKFIVFYFGNIWMGSNLLQERFKVKQ